MKKNGKSRRPISVSDVFRRQAEYGVMLVHALILTLVLESLGRHSPLAAVRFMLSSPLTFAGNVVIVYATVCLSAVFRSRRWFFRILITIVWLLFGTVNAVVLRYRMTPFSAEDFSMLPSLIRIADNYMTLPALIGIAAGLLALLALIVVLWLKVPKKQPRHSRGGTLVRIFLSLLLAAAVLLAGFKTGALSKDFMNLADAYEQYGFAYCFSVSLVDVGINRPVGYSKKMVRRAANKMRIRLNGASGATAGGLNTDTDVEEDVQPNLIMIQLESFFDPYYLSGFSYSEDPIPFFRELGKNHASGFITVPVVGAGTSNTEFEILTGMSTDYFGAGEYPYNTVLKTRTIEALPYLLKDSGYTSTVIHNNTGTFYNRDTVFANMGFDRFVPEEYMYDLERTPNNWARDSVLPGVILDCMEVTKGTDFVYTITVQSHGRYPESEVLEDKEKVITVTNTGGSAPTEAVEYYVNQIREVDDMIRELVEALEEQDEPILLLLFGDHLPALGFEKEEITQPSVYQTEYVIWNNYGADIPDRDIQSESVSTLLLDWMKIPTGIIPNLHRAYDGTKKYSDVLELFEYDMLYGEGYVFRELSEYAGAFFKETPDSDIINTVEETEPEEAATEEIEAPVQEAEDETEEPFYYEYAGYQPSDLEIGYREIRILGWYMGKTGVFVRGDNFNEFSRVILNDKVMDTLYLNTELLYVPDVNADDEIDSVAVGQFDENLKQLGETVVFERNES